jgi:hypothetical protein
MWFPELVFSDLDLDTALAFILDLACFKKDIGHYLKAQYNQILINKFKILGNQLIL